MKGTRRGRGKGRRMRRRKRSFSYRGTLRRPLLGLPNPPRGKGHTRKARRAGEWKEKDGERRRWKQRRRASHEERSLPSSEIFTRSTASSFRLLSPLPSPRSAVCHETRLTTQPLANTLGRCNRWSTCPDKIWYSWGDMDSTALSNKWREITG